MFRYRPYLLSSPSSSGNGKLKIFIQAIRNIDEAASATQLCEAGSASIVGQDVILRAGCQPAPASHDGYLNVKFVVFAATPSAVSTTFTEPLPSRPRGTGPRFAWSSPGYWPLPAHETLGMVMPPI